MIHKKIFESVLAQLDVETAEYYSDIANKLEADPRVQAAPNLVFLVLKDTAPFLPKYLPASEFINELLKFVKMHSSELAHVIYSREFVTDPDALRGITAKFVGRVMEVILEHYDDGQIAGEEKQSVHTVSWPYDEVDFPYFDDEDEE